MIYECFFCGFRTRKPEELFKHMEDLHLHGPKTRRVLAVLIRARGEA